MPANPTSVQEARDSKEWVQVVNSHACSLLSSPRLAHDWQVFDAHIRRVIDAVRRERDAEIRGMVEGVPTHADSEGRLHHRTALMFASDVLRLLSDREGA